MELSLRIKFLQHLLQIPYILFQCLIFLQITLLLLPYPQKANQLALFQQLIPIKFLQQLSSFLLLHCLQAVEQSQDLLQIQLVFLQKLYHSQFYYFSLLLHFFIALLQVFWLLLSFFLQFLLNLHCLHLQKLFSLQDLRLLFFIFLFPQNLSQVNFPNPQSHSSLIKYDFFFIIIIWFFFKEYLYFF